LSTSSTLADAEDCLSIVYNKCSTLINTLLPTVDDGDEIEAEGSEVEESGDEDAMMSGTGRQAVKLGKPGYSLTKDDAMRLQIRQQSRPNKLRPNNPFFQYLKFAFERDYKVRSIINFGWQDRISWYRRVSFISNSRKVSMATGSFLRLQNGVLARLEQVALVRFFGKRYPFLIVSRLELVDGKDPVLDNEIYRRSTLAVCGLPYIMDSKEYVIKAPADGPWLETAAPDNTFFMSCVWHLDYM
jgi:hypothetical protein